MSTHAARRYADPIDVRRDADVPAGFVWRGRRYTVRAVLAHWVEAGAWWRRLGGEGAAAPGLDDREREVWRVEAVGIRQAPASGRTGIFDLCFDWSAGTWSLVRAHD